MGSDSILLDFGGFVIFVIAILAIIKFFISLYMPSFDKSLLGGFAGKADDYISDSAIKPLAQIFLGFNHGSVDQWIEWIKVQEVYTKEKAFNNLVNYLDGRPGAIGAVAAEVIKAIVAFNYPESFTTISKFIESIRKKWKRYNRPELFYEIAAKGLVQLNQERAQVILTREFEMLKNKPEPDKLLSCLVCACAELEINSDMNKFWYLAMKDTFISVRVKDTIINEIAAKKEGHEISAIFSKALDYFSGLEVPKLSLNDARLLETLCVQSKRFFAEDDYKLWDSFVAASEKEHTGTLVKEIMVKFLEDDDFEIEQEQLIKLFNQGAKLDPEMMKTLAGRIELSPGEIELSSKNTDFYAEGYKLNGEKLKIHHHSGSKQVVPELADDYNFIEKTLVAKLDAANVKFPDVAFVIGNAYDEKLYIMDRLANNQEVSWMHVDTIQLLNSEGSIEHLRVDIAEHPSCLVFFDNLDIIYEEGLNEEQMKNFSYLGSMIREVASLKKAKFVANLGYSYEEIEEDIDFKGKFEGPLGIDFWFIREMNKPDYRVRQKIFNDKVKKVDIERFDDRQALDAVPRNTENHGMIEYLNYLNTYFRYCLLVYGKLLPPKELSHVGLALEEVDLGPEYKEVDDVEVEGVVINEEEVETCYISS